MRLIFVMVGAVLGAHNGAADGHDQGRTSCGTPRRVGGVEFGLGWGLVGVAFGSLFPRFAPPEEGPRAD